MVDGSSWVADQVERVTGISPNAKVDTRHESAFVYDGSVVYYFDNSTGEKIEDCWIQDDSDTVDGLCVEVEGVEYTAKKNSRYPAQNFWTLLANGKPFATIEPTDRDGWRGTFQTTGLSRALWGMSDNCSLEDRVQKMHNGYKEFLARVEVI